MQRPQPPADIFEISGASFVPSSDLEGWARQTFIEPDAELANEEHFHLNQARIGFVWTTTANARAGNRIVGQCELMPPMTTAASLSSSFFASAASLRTSSSENVMSLRGFVVGMAR